MLCMRWVVFVEALLSECSWCEEQAHVVFCPGLNSSCDLIHYGSFGGRHDKEWDGRMISCKMLAKKSQILGVKALRIHAGRRALGQATSRKNRIAHAHDIMIRELLPHIGITGKYFSDVLRSLPCRVCECTCAGKNHAQLTCKQKCTSFFFVYVRRFHICMRHQCISTST